MTHLNANAALSFYECEIVVAILGSTTTHGLHATREQYSTLAMLRDASINYE